VLVMCWLYALARTNQIYMVTDGLARASHCIPFAKQGSRNPLAEFLGELLSEEVEDEFRPTSRPGPDCESIAS
jgi:hypothetical protein